MNWKVEMLKNVDNVICSKHNKEFNMSCLECWNLREKELEKKFAKVRSEEHE